MKTTLIYLTCIAFVFIGGCRWNITDVNATAILGSSLAIEVGCEVKISGDNDLDRSLRNLYTYAATGEIPQDALDQLNVELSKHLDARPTLMLQLTNMAALLGAQVDLDTGELIGLSGVPPEVLSAVARGYNSGFNMCQVKE